MPLVLLMVAGLFNISADNLALKTWPLAKNIGELALVLFFASMGIETAPNVCGEIKNLRKTIPKGIFMGVFRILIIYLFIQLVTQGVSGNQLAMHNEAPLVSLATRLIGPFGGTIMLVAAAVSMFGTGNQEQ